jgi:hypothetical protein
MANVDAPRGFKLVGHMNGAAMNARTERMYVSASESNAVGIGSPVVRNGTSKADGDGAYAEVAAAQGTEGTPGTITGIIVGVDPVPGSLDKRYVPASTGGFVNVVTDPDALFEIQVDGAIAITDVGQTADMVQAAFDTTRQVHPVELDSSDIGTGAQLKIHAILNQVGNDLSANNAKVLVSINEHTDRATGTAL